MAVPSLSEAEIAELIGCPKTIVSPPVKNPKPDKGHTRNEFWAQSSDGRDFHVFMRQSEVFEENFSIGLRYLPQGAEALIIMRANGPHGLHSDPIAPHWHAHFHVHVATEENIDLGRKPESGGTITTEFASFGGALRYLLTRASIAWTESQFPMLARPQLNLDLP